MDGEQGRNGAGMARQSEAMVRALGGSSVTLRRPAPPVANDDGEALGLGTPLFEDSVLCPVAWRQKAKTTELLVPGALLEAELGLTGVDAVRTSLLQVAAVVAGGQSFSIATVEALQMFGQAYLYRIGCVLAGS